MIHHDGTSARRFAGEHQLRLGTIRGADRILVIVDGRIIGQGTHRDLIAKQRFTTHLIYTRIYTQRPIPDARTCRYHRGMFPDRSGHQRL